MKFSFPTHGLLILCATCQTWLALASPPVIFGPPERTYPAGDNFTLICAGAEPLNWSYPDSERSIFQEHLQKVSSGYESTLEVYNSDYLGTGYYECSDNKASARVYVYLGDLDNLLAVKPEDTILFRVQNQDVIIPCKPTAPEVNVTLERHDGFVNLDPGSYDPKVGFTISDLSVSDSGSFTCTAVKGSETESFDFYLTVYPHTEVAPQLQIDESSIHHVVLGQEVSLSCYVEADYGIIFLLDWIFPDKGANSTGRIVVGNTTVQHVINDQQRIWKNTLTIHQVKKADEGNYTCRIKDHNNNTNSDTKFMKVYSKEDKFINLTVQTSKIEVDATKEDHAAWILTLFAYPNAELHWYNPDGGKILRDTHETDKYRMAPKNNRITLEIYDVDVNDAGNYTVVASNDGGKKSVTLELVVYDKPSVKIKCHDYYKIGVPKNVTCRVSGYPTPTIQWSFKKCDFMEDKNCERHSFENISRKLSSITELQINESHIESKLEWHMKEPGLLNCLASNNKGKGNDTTIIRVTDVPQGFFIENIPKEIVIGDNITLACGVASYEYNPNLLWYFQSNEFERPKIISKEMIDQKNQSYAHWSTLKFDKINKNNSGIYTCIAGKLNEKFKNYLGTHGCVAEKPSKGNTKYEKKVQLKVLELEPPVIYDTNLTNSEVTIASWQPLSWRCAARGVPEPTIVWYKDDEVLSLNNNFSNLELSDNNQTLLVKTLTMDEEGIYICRARNKGGVAEMYMSLKLKEHHKTNTTLIITVVVVAILLVILVFSFILALWKIRKEKKQLKLAGLYNFNKGMTECINQDLTLDEQTDLLPYDPKWEFPRSKLKLGKQLGSGAFGVVLKAEAYGIVENEECTTVAVKMVKRQADSAYIRALASELKILAHLGKHLNVVNLLGACTKNIHKRELLVIVEFCTFGNVHNYLLSHRDIFIDQIDPETGEIDITKSRMISDYNRSRINYATLTFPRSVNSDPSSAIASVDTDTTCLTSVRSGEESFSINSHSNPDWCPNLKGDYLKNNVDMLSTSTLVCWAFQIARGMEYLASRRVLHGDLAARNVLLADNNIVKICDFGFAKSIYNNPEYRKSGDGPVPVKWMAIESVTHRIFSTQSDVWSFGIVLWELFSLARTPYPGFENFEIIHNKLIEGYRMEKPLYANQKLYDIMIECWDAQPCRRPSFSELVMKLGKLLENNVREHYIELNEPFKKYSVPEGEDYLSMVSPPTYDDPKPHYVNLPNDRPNNDSEPPDYLDMTTGATTPSGSGDESLEMKPMLSEKERSENDDYLIPRHIPTGTNCAFNPNYLVSQNKLQTDKSVSNYGKLNRVQQPQTEANKVKDNVTFFESIKNNQNRNQRTDRKEINKAEKNIYVNT